MLRALGETNSLRRSWLLFRDVVLRNVISCDNNRYCILDFIDIASCSVISLCSLQEYSYVLIYLVKWSQMIMNKVEGGSSSSPSWIFWRQRRSNVLPSYKHQRIQWNINRSKNKCSLALRGVNIFHSLCGDSAYFSREIFRAKNICERWSTLLVPISYQFCL